VSSISIIGTGNMARALAAPALASGNDVEIVGRDPVKATDVAAACGGATVAATDTAPSGDVVILAVPYSSAARVVTAYGDDLRGKVIVDLTNPITPDLSVFSTPDGSCGAEEIAKDCPVGVHVVKAFNTLPSDVLARGSADGRPLDVFVAGDDVRAKAAVSAFVESLGMRPLDVGGLSMAGALENVTLLHLGLVAHSVGTHQLLSRRQRPQLITPRPPTEGEHHARIRHRRNRSCRFAHHPGTRRQRARGDRPGSIGRSRKSFVGARRDRASR
jgi:8-hydroxy-5-deazaflavin:NADPH oxidoreductase